MYLSPESGRITTMFLPLFSGRFATCAAAQSAAPELIPTKAPSSDGNFAPYSNAASFGTVITSSYTFVSRVSGTKPAPIP